MMDEEKEIVICEEEKVIEADNSKHDERGIKVFNSYNGYITYRVLFLFWYSFWKIIIWRQ